MTVICNATPLINFAAETGIERILLEEREARQVAQQLGLPVMGTLGILLLAKSNQTIPQVRSPLDAMIRCNDRHSPILGQ